MWKTIEKDMGGPHTIASDGRFYVVDDTGKHRLRVYIRNGNTFELIQTVNNVGVRPHRVVYDPETQAFYVDASNSQTISKLVVKNNGLDLLYTKQLPYLGGRYTRSITIHHGHMFFVSGPNTIHETEYKDDSYSIINSWHVPDLMNNMNDIMWRDGYIWVTYSGDNPGVVRVRDLNDLEYSPPDMRASLGISETPYFFSEIEGRFYLPQIGSLGNGIISFTLDSNSNPTDIRTMIYFDQPTSETLAVEGSQPR
jgi:hypothetical protein